LDFLHIKPVKLIDLIRELDDYRAATATDAANPHDISADPPSLGPLDFIDRSRFGGPSVNTAKGLEAFEESFTIPRDESRALGRGRGCLSVGRSGDFKNGVAHRSEISCIVVAQPDLFD
jgi:hypothetical protein